MDNLDTYIIKLVRKEIVPSVCHILNLSIRSNKFPTKWKLAKIVPLYKGKGSKVDPPGNLQRLLQEGVLLALLHSPPRRPDGVASQQEGLAVGQEGREDGVDGGEDESEGAAAKQGGHQGGLGDVIGVDGEHDE